MTGHAMLYVRVVIPCLCLSVALVGLWHTPALAHARLIGSDPAADANPDEAPGQILLRFNEPVEAAFSPVEVYDAGGDRVDEDDARVDPDDARVVLVSLGRNLPDGPYSVDWRVTSIDGHVIEGNYEFVVGDPDTGASSDADRTEPAARLEEAEGQEAGAGGAHGGQYAALGFVVLVLLVAVVLRRR